MAVVVGSLLPGNSPAMQVVGKINDKFLHFAAYAVLAVLPVFAAKRMRTVIVIAAFLVALGLGMEYGQLEVPQRSFDMLDFGADAAGVLCGIATGVLRRAAGLAG